MAGNVSRIALAMLVLALSPTKDERLLAQPTPALDQRPLKLPLLRAGERCPTTTGSRDRVPHQEHIFGSGGFWFGNDPAFVGLGGKTPTRWMTERLSAWRRCRESGIPLVPRQCGSANPRTLGPF
jgi:hypothetical protein